MAEFFRRKLNAVLALCCSLIFTFCFAYGFYLNGAKRVVVEHTFYFLVSKNMHVETSAHLSKWQGGAGYVLEKNDKLYVVHSVYTDEKTAKIIENSNAEVELLSATGGELYFVGLKEKKEAKNALLSLETLYNEIKLVNETAVRLEGVLTQEKAKGLIKDVVIILKGVGRSSREKFLAFSKTCADAAEKLDEVCKGVLFAKDLRYVACLLADGYLNFCNQFRL